MIPEITDLIIIWIYKQIEIIKNNQTIKRGCIT